MLVKLIHALIFIFIFLITLKSGLGYSIALSPDIIEFDLSSVSIRKQITIFNPEERELSFSYEISKDIIDKVEILYDNDLLKPYEKKKVYVVLKNKESLERLYMEDSIGYISFYFNNDESTINTALMAKIRLTNLKYKIVDVSGSFPIEKENNIQFLDIFSGIKDLKEWERGLLIILGVCVVGLFFVVILKIIYAIYSKIILN